MKKIYFLLLTILGAMSTVSAQEITVRFGDKLVKNGDVLTVSEPHNTVMPMGTKYEFSSGITVEAEAEDYISIVGTVTKFESDYDDMSLSLCPVSSCTYLIDGMLQNTFLYYPSNGALDIQLHLGASKFVTGVAQPIVDVELDMSIAYTDYKEESEVKFKLIFCNDPSAAVASISKDNSLVKFANNNLTVNLDKAETVEIFSTTGARVKVVKAVKSATINLASLQKGLYFYRVGKKTGKFIVK
jgi:hypothetical protein